MLGVLMVVLGDLRPTYGKDLSNVSHNREVDYEEACHYSHRNCSSRLSAYHRAASTDANDPGRAYATSFTWHDGYAATNGEAKQSGERTPRDCQRGICQCAHWCECQEPAGGKPWKD